MSQNNPVTLLHADGIGWHWRQIVRPGKELKHGASFILLKWETIPQNASQADLQRAKALLTADDDKPF